MPSRINLFLTYTCFKLSTVSNVVVFFICINIMRVLLQGDQSWEYEGSRSRSTFHFTLVMQWVILGRWAMPRLWRGTLQLKNMHLPRHRRAYNNTNHCAVDPVHWKGTFCLQVNRTLCRIFYTCFLIRVPSCLLACHLNKKRIIIC